MSTVWFVVLMMAIGLVATMFIMPAVTYWHPGAYDLARNVGLFFLAFAAIYAWVWHLNK